MGWTIKSGFAEYVTNDARQSSTFGYGPSSVVKRTAVSAIFPDHWWGDEWWRQLKLAGRYDHVISAITLNNPPNSTKTAQEASDVLALKMEPDYQSRLTEIVEEHEGPPAYYHRMLFADKDRNFQTADLIKRTIVWSLPPIMYFKHKWKRARPTQLEPKIRPVVDCPTHPAYPSGHSTQAHLIALVMLRVTGRKDIGDALWNAGTRIAQNREYAGLHYRSDSDCGADLATQLLPFFVAEHDSIIDRIRSEEWG